MIKYRWRRKAPIFRKAQVLSTLKGVVIMLDGQRTYVIDTNILVDYVDVIPSPEEPEKQPENPTIDLSQAHIVVPTAVIRELSSFKKEKSERGKSARIVLKRIREMVEGKPQSMKEIYNLEKPTHILVGDRTFSILPVHKNFKTALPFCPSEDDMDGQIILTALSVAFIQSGLPVDGTATSEAVMNLHTKEVILLTNDNGLAIRARERGLMTSRYGHKYPEPYTGRREVVVPPELFKKFYDERRIERIEWQETLPNEPDLIANEFLIMKLSNPAEYPKDFRPENTPYFEYIGRYDVNEDAIVGLKYISDFPAQPKNAGQAIYAEALMNPEFAAVICTGPAGSGKTYMATVYGYNACKDGQYIGVTVVPCEDHGKLGALPGDLDEKMDPDVQPIKNALRNYLLKEDSKLRKELDVLQRFGTGNKVKCAARGKNQNPEDEAPDKRSLKVKLKDRVNLIWDNWFSSIPIDNARGRDFSYELALYDEFQDQNASQADTLIKRIGDGGKIILTGDIWQIHAPYLDANDNGLVYASAQLFDHPMVAQVCFTEDEVVRHPLVKMIAKRQKEGKTENPNVSYPNPDCNH